MTTVRHDRLRGDNVYLRPIEPADLASSVHWRNDPATRDPQLGFPFPVTAAMEERWFDKVTNDAPHGASFAVADLATNELIGFVFLSRIDAIARHAQVGITVGPQDRRNRGLGREAIGLLVGYAFDTLNLERLWLRVAAFNTAAIRLYHHHGFVEEGRLRNHAFVSGRYHDVLMMGLLRADRR